MPASTTRYVGGAGGSAYVERIDGYDAAYHPTSTTTVIPDAEGALAGTYTSKATYKPVTGLLADTTYNADGGPAAERTPHRTRRRRLRRPHRDRGPRERHRPSPRPGGAVRPRHRIPLPPRTHALSATRQHPGHRSPHPRNTLYNSLYRADDEQLVNAHVWGVNAYAAPVWHLRRHQESGMFDTYAESFNAVWTSATPVREEG
jgi:hypothetical protein